jgi:CheY-like chemotaxis protein
MSNRFHRPFIYSTTESVERVTGPVGTNKRILLVDDNHIQSVTRRAVLEASGREICIAPQGQQALELLSDPETAKSIGLIITDHLMPVMTGFEFVSELRRRGFTTPVVVLSGFPDAEACYGGLNVVFRLKPFDPASLIQLVRELLGECMRRSA